MKVKNSLYKQILSTLFLGALLPAILLLILAAFYAWSNLETAVDKFYRKGIDQVKQAELNYLYTNEKFQKIALKEYKKVYKDIVKSFRPERFVSHEKIRKKGRNFLYKQSRKRGKLLQSKHLVKLNKVRKKLMKEFPNLNDKNFDFTYFDYLGTIMFKRNIDRLATSRVTQTMQIIRPGTEENATQVLLQPIVNLLARRLDNTYGIDKSFVDPFKEVLEFDLVPKTMKFRTMAIYDSNLQLIMVPLYVPEKFAPALFPKEHFPKITADDYYFGYLVLSLSIDQFLKDSLQTSEGEAGDFALLPATTRVEESDILLFGKNPELEILDPATNKQTGKKAAFKDLFKEFRSGLKMLKTLHFGPGQEPIYSLMVLDTQLSKYVSVYQVKRKVLLQPTIEFLHWLAYLVAGLSLLMVSLALIVAKWMTRPLTRLSNIIEDCSRTFETGHLDQFTTRFYEVSIVRNTLHSRIIQLNRQFLLLEHLAKFQDFLASNPENEDFKQRGSELYQRLFGKAFHPENSSEESAPFDQQIKLFLERKNMELEMQKSVAQKREFEVAQEIQMDLLPKGLEKYDRLYTFYLAARYLGGDFYDVVERNGELYLIIADVSGKGLPASLFGATIKAYMTSLIDAHLPVEEILVEVNEYLVENPREGFFCTLFLLRINPETGQFDYASAGHNKMMLVKPDGIELLSGKGLPLGLFSFKDYERKDGQLQKGEYLFLYTDGVTEAEDKDFNLYDMPRLEEFVQKSLGNSARQIGEDMLTDLKKFTGEAEQSDDITYLIYTG